MCSFQKYFRISVLQKRSVICTSIVSSLVPSQMLISEERNQLFLSFFIMPYWMMISEETPNVVKLINQTNKIHNGTLLQKNQINYFPFHQT